MKLYGSKTSPFVRRLRILLAEQNYEFSDFNIFGPEREALKAKNPTLKVPMFEDQVDGELVTIFDSGVTYRYLEKKLGLTPLTLEKQNLLSIVDACNDSMVNLLILKRSGIDTEQNALYFKIQSQRQNASFDYLEKIVEGDLFADWDYLAICLLNLIQWAQFRNLYDFSNYPKLLGFVEKHLSQPGVLETMPEE